MLTMIAARTLAALMVIFLIALAMWVVVDPGNNGHPPKGTDLLFLGIVILLGFFGATVSFSIGEISKPHRSYLKRFVRFGSLVYLVLSIGLFFAGAMSVSLGFILLRSSSSLWRRVHR
jgi:hypothetical protein